MSWIIPLALVVLFELIADIFTKEYSLKGHWYLWVGAIVGYIICNTFFLSAVKNGSGIARGAIIFSVASAVFAGILGIYFYNESITRIQFIGMMLGTLSLVLIFWE